MAWYFSDLALKNMAKAMLVQADHETHVHTTNTPHQ